MSIIRVSEILGDDYPELDVCKNDGSSLSVFQWQSIGNLTASISDGVTLTTEEFIKKSIAFVKEAIEINASLGLTPEYCFPYEVLELIAKNPEMRPKPGKLWCLGGQGINYNSLFKKLKSWENDTVTILYNAFEFREIKSFVSPLFYVFISKSNRLCVIPQFKTGQMADARNTFEGAQLCFGKYIYLFDLENSNNVFLSIICADILHINARHIIEDIQQRSITLFHPQLNSNPRNEDIITFRRELFRTNEKDVRIITLNWAEGTKCSTSHFNVPLSAFYKRQTNSLESSSFRKCKEENHKNGTAYFNNNHVEMWISHRYEHCKLIYICKGDTGIAASVVAHRDEPTTAGCYLFEQDKWIKKYLCTTNINLIFEKNGNFISKFPDCDNCDNCRKSDFFYGSLLGHFEDAEVNCEYEFSDRLLFGCDKESDEKREKKLTLLLELQHLLQSGYFPEQLNYLDNNYEFSISDYFISGGEIYNLSPIQKEFPDPQVLVVITESISLEYVETLWKKLYEKLHERYRGQILLYYKVIGKGYKYFDKYLDQIKIKNYRYTINSTSYKSGFSIFNLFRRG